MNRIAFLIDGFNLYHSLKNASYDLGLRGRGTKWLDIQNLCALYLHLISKDASISSIFYFTALAYHLQSQNPQVVTRHKKYIRCIADTGVIPVIAKFKKSHTPADIVKKPILDMRKKRQMLRSQHIC